ncbi:DUF1345 domain-containing protein [Rhizobiaceae bacterium n13]|uniref:DUF1345 domain-containing protein n=1 Tax=Ferirhizobium litorale TaxID=2927786 RepID=A0AAE3QCA1_9HYPH|nr:DUF1345 domain-containing protein [Fererhizobium litorale]MDI7860404.1 DUF1345 domain-containing protein [Fererhizobium litorale]MDI7920539.1 DUF1345 domain-containing protein [Fererhizobium litorale]
MSSSRRRNKSVLSFFVKHINLVAAVVVGILVLPLQMLGPPLSHDALLAWICGVLAYLATSWYRMLNADVDQIRQRATELDSSEVVIFGLSVGAALASLGGIGFELHGIESASGGEKLLRASLVMTTILLSWTFLHTLFTIHYAHRYYGEPEGGLGFPGHPRDPIYWDFLYFSFTIGVASQTADIDLTSMPMRRLVLFHSILSFLFNATILALAINVGASIL